MSSILQFFLLLGYLVPLILFIWWLISTVGRALRVAEDIALTLRRIEQNGVRLQQ